MPSDQSSVSSDRGSEQSSHNQPPAQRRTDRCSSCGHRSLDRQPDRSEQAAEQPQGRPSSSSSTTPQASTSSGSAPQASTSSQGDGLAPTDLEKLNQIDATARAQLACTPLLPSTEAHCGLSASCLTTIPGKGRLRQMSSIRKKFKPKKTDTTPLPHALSQSEEEIAEREKAERQREEREKAIKDWDKGLQLYSIPNLDLSKSDLIAPETYELLTGERLEEPREAAYIRSRAARLARLESNRLSLTKSLYRDGIINDPRKEWKQTGRATDSQPKEGGPVPRSAVVGFHGSSDRSRTGESSAGMQIPDPPRSDTASVCSHTAVFERTPSVLSGRPPTERSPGSAASTSSQYSQPSAAEDQNVAASNSSADATRDRPSAGNQRNPDVPTGDADIGIPKLVLTQSSEAASSSANKGNGATKPQAVEESPVAYGNGNILERTSQLLEVPSRSSSTSRNPLDSVSVTPASGSGSSSYSSQEQQNTRHRRRSIAAEYRQRQLTRYQQQYSDADGATEEQDNEDREPHRKSVAFGEVWFAQFKREESDGTDERQDSMNSGGH